MKARRRPPDTVAAASVLVGDGVGGVMVMMMEVGDSVGG